MSHDQLAAVIDGAFDNRDAVNTGTQGEIRERMADAFGSSTQPFKFLEEMALQNAAMFQETWLDAIRRMMPFAPAKAAETTTPPHPRGRNGSAEGHEAGSGGQSDEIAALKEQMAALERRLNALSDDEKPQNP